MKVNRIDYVVCVLLVILFVAMLGLYDIYKNDQPEVGTAIGVQYVYANGLSDETKELVEDLRWKHYGSGTFYMSDFVYDWLNVSFDDENGILYVETNNGMWFIQMQRKEE